MLPVKAVIASAIRSSRVVSPATSACNAPTARARADSASTTRTSPASLIDRTAAINPAGLGLGDVKLGLVLGLHLGWLGWSQVLAGAVLGFVLQAVVAVVLLGLLMMIGLPTRPRPAVAAAEAVSTAHTA